MGSRVIALAQDRKKEFLVVPEIGETDVLIDFSHPEATLPNLELAAKAKKGMVIGTTGHTPDQLEKIREYGKKIPVVLAPNMSVGVNVLAKLLTDAARILGKDFTVKITETHHIHKKDKPSGTALQWARAVATGVGIDAGKISIESIREGEVVGIHTIRLESAGEVLEFTHNAKSRDTFALGALRAAQWVVGKPNGIYTMTDVLGISQ